MDLGKELQNFLDEQSEAQFLPEVDEETDVESAKEKYKITSMQSADYFVRKIKEIELYEAEVDATVKAEIERVKANAEAWAAKEKEKNTFIKSFFKSLLETYASEQLKDKKTRTLALPSGSLCFKKQQNEYNYDDKAVITFLKEIKPDLINKEIIEKYDKKVLKSLISEQPDGSVLLGDYKVPGVSFTERNTKFEIK